MSLSATAVAGPGPNPFDFVLDIDNVFAYDGTSNLLLEINVTSGSISPAFDAYGSGVEGFEVVSSLLSDPNGDTEGTIGGSNGLVVQFTLVPAPAAAGLAIPGICGLLWRRPRRR